MQGYFEDTIVSSDLHWPGRQSTVIVFQGNDFRCPFGEPNVEQAEEYQKDLKEVITEAKKAIAYSQNLFIGGGEPTLQREALLQILRSFKKLGVMTGLETNATKPYALKQAIEQSLVDYVRVRLPAPLELPQFQRVTRSATFFRTSQDIINDVKDSLELLQKHQDRIQVSFKTTIVPGLIYRKENLYKIGQSISDFDSDWCLKPFNPSDKPTLSKRYAEINPPSKGFLLELISELSRKLPRLKIQAWH